MDTSPEPPGCPSSENVLRPEYIALKKIQSQRPKPERLRLSRLWLERQRLQASADTKDPTDERKCQQAAGSQVQEGRAGQQEEGGSSSVVCAEPPEAAGSPARSWRRTPQSRHKDSTRLQTGALIRRLTRLFLGRHQTAGSTLVTFREKRVPLQVRSWSSPAPRHLHVGRRQWTACVRAAGHQPWPTDDPPCSRRLRPTRAL